MGRYERRLPSDAVPGFVFVELVIAVVRKHVRVAVTRLAKAARLMRFAVGLVELFNAPWYQSAQILMFWARLFSSSVLILGLMR